MIGFFLVDLQASYPIAVLIVLGPGFLPQHTHGIALAGRKIIGGGMG